MKNVSDWDIDYILNLPLGEYDWVEFKESRKLDFTLPGINLDVVLNELSKQISAFSNSGGGAIVYGIEDIRSGTSRNIDKNGGVSLNIKNDTKEWLEDRIPNLVDFPLEKFNVYPLISDTSGGLSQGKGVFVIDIPSSEIAPHQATDNKYYARIGGKSKPINHRFVIDMMGRTKHPKLTMVIKLLSDKEKGNTRFYDRNNLVITARCRNVSSIYAKYVNGWIYLPKSLFSKYDETEIIKGKEYFRGYFENIHKDMVGQREVYRRLPSINDFESTRGYTDKEPLYLTRFDPILPKLSCFVLTEKLKFTTLEELEPFAEEEIHLKIYTDNAPLEKGFITIKEILDNYEK